MQPKLVATGNVTASATVGAAVNDRGAGAVLLSRCISTRRAVRRATRCQARDVLLVRRRAGGRFSAPETLARGTGRPWGSVAVGEGGDVLTAWTERIGGVRVEGQATQTLATGDVTLGSLRTAAFKASVVWTQPDGARVAAIEPPRGGPQLTTFDRADVPSAMAVGSFEDSTS